MDQTESDTMIISLDQRMRSRPPFPQINRKQRVAKGRKRNPYRGMRPISFVLADIFDLRTAKSILMLEYEKPENNKRAYRTEEA